MSQGKDMVGAFLGLGLGVFLFLKGFSLFRKKKLIEDIPTSTVRGMAMGLVEICGQAQRHIALCGPFSQKECVAYTYLIERYERRGKSTRWVPLAQGNSFYCPFFVSDGTGRVLVQPQDNEFMVRVNYTFENNFFKPIPAPLIEFMDHLGISHQGLWGSSKFKFTERNIQPGDAIYILGTACQQNETKDFEEQYQSRLRQRLAMVKGNEEFMRKADLNQDGNVSFQEWDQAVKKIEQELLQQELNRPLNLREDDVVIGKGENNKVFIISDESQKKITTILGWQIVAAILGGVALAVGCLAYVLSKAHLLY